MDNVEVQIRHVLLYYFRKGKTVTEVYRKICAVYGKEAVTKGQIRNWFAKFRYTDYLVRKAQSSGRPFKNPLMDMLNGLQHAVDHSSSDSDDSDSAVSLDSAASLDSTHTRQSEDLSSVASTSRGVESAHH